MPLVPAKCTQCGANIQVDDTKEAGICDYCGTAFITEKVVNNYAITNNIQISNATITVAGANIDNLLLRAEQYEKVGDRQKALEYYNKVLDIDATNEKAKEKVFGKYSYSAVTTVSPKRKKNKWVTFFLCLYLGVFGVHKYYEGNKKMGTIYLCTLGLFGLGWFYDIIATLFKPTTYYV